MQVTAKWEENCKAGRPKQLAGSLLSESLSVGDIEDDGYLRPRRFGTGQGEW